MASTKRDRPTEDAYRSAAWYLNVLPAAIAAVSEVEAGPNGAFLDTGEPVILFERHHFDRMTDGLYRDRTVPGIPAEVANLSSPVAGGYGKPSIQHRKLAAAIKLDREGALKSCSWGLFQIMGFNHEAAGHARLQDFVNAMYADVDDHLRAFCNFIRNDPRLLTALRRRDWVSFARYYNGPAYARNKYDEKIAQAYADLAATMQIGRA